MTFYNRTRTSPSITRRLVTERKLWLVPVYHVLRTSTLAREAIEHSGSYQFADHIYAGRPRGRFLIGTLIDWIFLRLPSAQAFRARYVSAKREIRALVEARAATDEPIDVLAVPSGLARELLEVAGDLRRERHRAADRLRWYAIDLDPEVIRQLRQADAGRSPDRYVCGDAFDPNAYGPNRRYDLIVSQGFTEFLTDAQTIAFYSLIREKLKPGGRFVTSGLRRHRLSDYLMRNLAELHAVYRSEAQLRALAELAGFQSLRTYTDRYGLLTMLIATNETANP